MNWRAKALVQVVVSNMPFSEEVNYLGQRHLLKNLPVGEAKLADKVRAAQRHLDVVTHHGSVAVADARFYEFGAGRDLIGPLALFCLGVNRQILVDIRRIVRVELVNDAITRLRNLDAGFIRLPDQVSPGGHLGAHLSSLGIEYRAPSDARASGLPDRSVDYVTSTSTLEHIPPADIVAILEECRRILQPPGLMSLFIDYQDHYSYGDSSISAYNFLRYEEARWALWSPSLQFQNRLRHLDHLRLLDDAGFEVVLEEKDPAQPGDLEQITSLPPASRFRSYTTEELAIRGSLIVVRPTGVDAESPPAT